MCVSGPRKASIEPVTVYAMIAHCLATLHDETRGRQGGLENVPSARDKINIP